MRKWLRGIALAGVAMSALIATPGCHEHEHRKVRVMEERHEGEVHEDKPGEMTVE